jgi:hypothetical protein
MTKMDNNKMLTTNDSKTNNKEGKTNAKDEKLLQGNFYSPALEHIQKKLIFENNNILICV